LRLCLPPLRFEENTSCVPSGENAGLQSSWGEFEVRLTAPSPGEGVSRFHRCPRWCLSG
jgi:hypothetical protein